MVQPDLFDQKSPQWKVRVLTKVSKTSIAVACHKSTNPFTFYSEICEHVQGHSGVLIKTVDSIMNLHSPPIQLQLEDEFATAASMAQSPGSSYTACAIDVSVGNVDVCLGPFWVRICSCSGIVFALYTNQSRTDLFCRYFQKQ